MVKGHEFNTRSVHYQVTTLGKLFALVGACALVVIIRLVTFTLQFKSFACNTEQVAKLLGA